MQNELKTILIVIGTLACIVVAARHMATVSVLEMDNRLLKIEIASKKDTIETLRELCGAGEVK